MTTAAPRLVSCKVCGLPHALAALEPGTVATCTRCGSRIEARSRKSLGRTAAFSLAALMLFLPANIFPILELELYGSHSSNTVFDGVVRFWRAGDLFLAVIVLLASIVIPLLKLAGLFFLVITTQLNMHRWKRMRTWIFRFIDTIGRWAMLDVFVLAIWVALVKLDTLGKVTAGVGMLPFGCVVVLTLLASASFDPQLIWEREEELHERS